MKHSTDLKLLANMVNLFEKRFGEANKAYLEAIQHLSDAGYVRGERNIWELEEKRPHSKARAKEAKKSANKRSQNDTNLS